VDGRGDQHPGSPVTSRNARKGEDISGSETGKGVDWVGKGGAGGVRESYSEKAAGGGISGGIKAYIVEGESCNRE